jgi:NADH-quinone oxidoreductase subunit D
VGVLTKQHIKDFGAVGPVARASGVDIDIRRDDPYAAYPLLEWKVITAAGNGDVFDKAVVRLTECLESIKIITQCLDAIDGKTGEIGEEVRKVPEGEGFGRHEAPRGECFHFVRSDVANSPIRHKIRAPSYTNVPTFKASCIGQTISDVAIILAGVDPCYCCTERVAVYDAEKKNKLYDFQHLLELSRKKTEKIRKEI